MQQWVCKIVVFGILLCEYVKSQITTAGKKVCSKRQPSFQKCSLAVEQEDQGFQVHSLLTQRYQLRIKNLAGAKAINSSSGLHASFFSGIPTVVLYAFDSMRSPKNNDMIMGLAMFVGVVAVIGICCSTIKGVVGSVTGTIICIAGGVVLVVVLASKFAFGVAGSVEGAPPISFSKGFQVFTDIDDTLICSAGPPAGKDRSCYKHELYPGVFQFMLELSRGPNEIQNPAKVVPLSARPAVLAKSHTGGSLGILDLKDDDLIAMASNAVGESNSIPSWGLNLDKAQYGKLRDWVLPHSLGVGMDKTKFQRWQNFETDKPTVFVGDNGQGDQSAAEKMASAEDSHLAAVFIHNVVRQDKVVEPNSEKIHLFDTYLDAAAIALDLGLISQQGAERVQDAFKSSSIVQMCLNRNIFTKDLYPCKKGDQIVDSTTFEPLPVVLDTQDGTARIQECSPTNPDTVEEKKNKKKPDLQIQPDKKNVHLLRCFSIQMALDQGLNKREAVARGEVPPTSLWAGVASGVSKGVGSVASGVSKGVRSVSSYFKKTK